jgi:hypothetical protein
MVGLKHDHVHGTKHGSKTPKQNLKSVTGITVFGTSTLSHLWSYYLLLRLRLSPLHSFSHSQRLSSVLMITTHDTHDSSIYKDLRHELTITTDDYTN